MDEIYGDGDAGRFAIKPAVAGGEATADEMTRYEEMFLPECLMISSIFGVCAVEKWSLSALVPFRRSRW